MPLMLDPQLLTLTCAGRQRLSAFPVSSGPCRRWWRVALDTSCKGKDRRLTVLARRPATHGLNRARIINYRATPFVPRHGFHLSRCCRYGCWSAAHRPGSTRPSSCMNRLGNYARFCQVSRRRAFTGRQDEDRSAKRHDVECDAGAFGQAGAAGGGRHQPLRTRHRRWITIAHRSASSDRVRDCRK